MALIRKTGTDSNFCDWACACRELTRCSFDSPVAGVLSDTASVVSVKDTSKVHWVNPDHIGDPSYSRVVRKRLVEQFDCLPKP
jgi:hypothetical protein